MSDASALLAQLQRRELTVEALARQCLDRVAEREPLIEAWAHLEPALVLEQARALDRLGPDPLRRPLFGLPIGIKDVLLTQDMPTQYNSALFDSHHPRVDAACVATLRAAGALIFGKTATVEFAATGRPARTRNPWDTERTPGGSSSGSAAAVADGHVPLALGTQTGGSMIRPASFCGVWALKPTWNLVSTEGAKRFATSLDTVGWYGRSAADLQLLLGVLGGPLLGAPPPVVPEVAGLRVALCRSPAWPWASEGAQLAVARAEMRLRAAGAEVVPLQLPASFDGLIGLQRLVMRSEGGSAFLDLHRRHGDALEQSLRDCVDNRDGVTAALLCSAYDEAARCRQVFDDLAAGFDAVLTPSAVGVAPLGLANTGDYVFNAIWSLLHVPCVHVPGLQGEQGLPFGLTLTGPRYADQRLLAIAAALGRVIAEPGAEPGAAPVSAC